jgi:5-methylthioadenosine/S-adenosylhomocysteine deaminase
LQALNAGVTTIADWAHNLPSPQHADANIRALRDSGIRGIFLYGGPGENRRSDGVVPAFTAEARRLRDEYFPSGIRGRLRMGLALRGPYFATSEANQADFALARELGLPISVHAGMAGFPGAVHELDKLGLLGPDVNYAHANEFTPQEFELVAASGGSIALSPSIDMTMALGVYPATGHALAYGIPAGLAADTVASGSTDLFSEMRLALAAERSRMNSAAVSRGEAVPRVELDHHDMLRLATTGGAQVWRLDAEIGTLTPGKRADVIVVDLRPPHLDGFGDPVLSLLLGAGPADVETVLLDGDIVKMEGKLVGPVVDEARHLMHTSRKRLGRP